jgi:hypothetical protein
MARKKGVNIDEFEKATNVSFFGLAGILGVAIAGSFALTGIVGWGNGGSNPNGARGRVRDQERERKPKS